jgi:HSP20 family protein
MLWSDLERLGSVLDPWREFVRMSRALSRLDGPSVEFPAVNVWVSGDHAVVTTEIPGLDPKNIDISVVKDSLTLRGSRQAEELKKGESYHRRERWSGQFTKTLELPFAVEAGKVEARFSKGILYISLPRAEADKPKKISVKTEQD